MSKISRFTTKAVTLAKNVVADYALVSLHCLRIYLDESYRNALDLLSEMLHILAEIGLEEGDLPDHSTLVKAFDKFQMKVWRVLLRLSAFTNQRFVRTRNRYGISGRSCTTSRVTPPLMPRFSTAKTLASTTAAARITAFRHSKRRLSSIRKPKLFSTFIARPRKPTTHNSAGRSPAQRRRPAQPRRRQRLRLDAVSEKLREEGVRPLIKHRIFRPIDHAHNARADGPRYRQRSMCDTVFSSIKPRTAMPCERERGTVNFVNSS